jgi:hypothetical protein
MFSGCHGTAITKRLSERSTASTVPSSESRAEFGQKKYRELVITAMMQLTGESGGSDHVTFLLNFFDELRRRVLGKK